MSGPPVEPSEGVDESLGAAEEFAARLRDLFAAAGNPTLAATSDAVGGRVTAGALSHWRTGRHLPARFETIEPVLVLLLGRRLQRIAADVSAPAVSTDARLPRLESIDAWKLYFARATADSPRRRSLLAAITAAEELTHSPDIDQAALKEICLSLLEADTAGEVRATAAVLTRNSRQLSAAADAMTRVGIVTSDQAGSQLLWAYSEVLTEWETLAVWSRDYRDHLKVRSALVLDAQRWRDSEFPRDLLYRHVRLSTVSESLSALHPTPHSPRPDIWFGSASPDQIPESASEFWGESQEAAHITLQRHKMIMLLVIIMIGLAVTLSAVVGALI